jgi:prophage regulatory protein
VCQLGFLLGEKVMNNVDDQPVLIKLSQIQQMTSMSKAFVYLLIQSGEFPKQVKIGRSSFWVPKFR